MSLPTGAPAERAFLVGLALRHKRDSFTIEDSMAELERLADTDGLVVTGKTIQHLARPNPATLIGRGKLNEIVAARDELQFDVVIFNDELAPNQQREVEEAFAAHNGKDIKVIDRTALILDIFAQHARTREGALQVELAQYEYRLPRLTRMWTHLARQVGGASGRGGSGGVGLRGPGERQLELDRREIRSRISHLKKELELVRRQRAEHRRKRRKEGIPVISIVGYTNSGKSTLLNALTNADVLVADQLFATLDPTTRRVVLPRGTEVLFSDTVGFIQKLPTQLIAAFRATLEEICESDVILHVVDITHPNAREQMASVEQTLEEIGVIGKPIILAFNKWDLAELHKNHDGDIIPNRELIKRHPEGVLISALIGTGLDLLLKRVEDVLVSGLVRVKARIPFAAGDLVNLFHRKGVVEREEYSSQGTLIEGRLPSAVAGLFAPYRVR